MLMVFVLVLRKIEGDRAVCLTVNELLDFRIETFRISSGVPCATIEPWPEHDHAGGDSKCARHVVSDHHRSHVFSLGQLDR